MITKLKNIIKYQFRKDLPLIAVSVILLGISTFWIGFHNMDHCQGLMKLECEIGSDKYNIIEKNSNNENWSLEDCYIHGVNQIIIGMVFMFFSCILFGVFYEKYKRGLK